MIDTGSVGLLSQSVQHLECLHDLRLSYSRLISVHVYINCSNYIRDTSCMHAGPHMELVL
jgi:hypothetical protein